MAFSFMIAFGVGLYLAKKRGFNENTAYHLVLLIVPMSILGIRVLYVIYNPGTPFFAFRDGGGALMGGIAFGLLTLFIYTRIRKVGFFTLCDFIVVGMILAQSIGRWGNFTNGELYGWRVDGGFFPFVVDIGGHNHLAMFFLESILNLIGFFVLLQVLKRQKTWGTTSGAYFIWYGTVRAILEPFRQNPDLAFGNSSIIFNQANFLIALLLIAFGCAILFLGKKGLLNQEHAALLNKPREEEEVQNERNPETL